MHSNLSDGDAAPEKVINWYKDHGFSFVFLTDHNRLSNPTLYKSIANKNFIILSGEEVSWVVDPGQNLKKIPVHLNSLCSKKAVIKEKHTSVRVALQKALEPIKSQPGAIAQINHPNFGWALTFDDIINSKGADLIEIANQHPLVKNEGNDTHPSTEALWDRLLSRNKRLYGTATDDTHHLYPTPDQKIIAAPGKGWVELSSSHLTPRNICKSIKKGDFYFSTGVELTKIDVRPQEYEVNIALKPDQTETSVKTEFIGRNGKVLSTISGPVAVYKLQGKELYVRARVMSSDGTFAWTQPVFTK